MHRPKWQLCNRILLICEMLGMDARMVNGWVTTIAYAGRKTGVDRLGKGSRSDIRPSVCALQCKRTYRYA
jgi:hypothetical protein